MTPARFSEELLSQVLDSDQLAAATAPNGPVCILAGAGTGKTRTITYRIANLIERQVASPRSILAVTFTSRAAGEMRSRLDGMGIPGVQALTFHAAALRQLKYFWPKMYGNAMPWTVLSNKWQLVARAMRGAGVIASPETQRDLVGEIEWAKSCMITPEQYPEATVKMMHEAPIAPEKVAAVFANYEQLKITGERVFLDFDDLLTNMAIAMERFPACAEEFRSVYQTFLVDEYQDVTPLQQRVLDGWLGERDQLTVVGDANQTIYTFNGATPDYLLGFSRKYPHATMVRLQRDYRSTQEIVHLANTVIGQATGRAAGTRLQLEGMAGHGPAPEFQAFDDEPAEAAAVARRISGMIAAGIDPAEIAVLFRINAQSAAFEQALTSANIAYEVRGGEGFFKRPEITAAMQALAAGVDKKGLAQKTDLTGPALAASLLTLLVPLGLTDTEPAGQRERERWQYLKGFAGMVEQFCANFPVDPADRIVRRIYERAGQGHAPASTGVTLASLHAAKGLEWDHVFLVGMSDATIPNAHAVKMGPEAIEEERRLFYVGITRARHTLIVSYSQARHEGGRKTRSRTRFLDGIAPDENPVKQRKVRCRSCKTELTSQMERFLGRCLTCPPSANEQQLVGLREWRKQIAARLQVPAYVIFSDATLTAIVEKQPRSKEQLLQVPGIGPAKFERFGQEILSLLAGQPS